MKRDWIKPFLVLVILTVGSLPIWGQTENGKVAIPETGQDKKHSNALAKETSPYLLKHAHNPVNWYGWGEEALQLAKKEKKLIFLSIGYSSCHWCHVMERESFMDDEIAKFLNDNFICIKVDREERPDVDSIYMQSLRIVNPRTSGGWPLSMFLTPQAKPFFGGTYFPARDGERGARIGFLTVVKRVHDTWTNKEERVTADADYVVKRLKTAMAQPVPENAQLDASWIENCSEALSRAFDPAFGGFSFSPMDAKLPKFPEPSNLMFLADQIRLKPDQSDKLKKMYVTTCEKMMMGGILDHVGGGFHRYSVDRHWKIPHFEKMLYDNGQLTTVYSEAYSMTGREDFRFVVEEMIDFVMREMKDAGGAFYSALDAESEGEEGKFYRWDLDEFESALTDDEFSLFAKVYGAGSPPNFEKKYYVPLLAKPLTELATELGMEYAELAKKLAPIRKKLYDVRAKRVRPLTDQKILASWNGMMIRGLADAGRILKRDDYLGAASDAADFVLTKMVDADGRLFRTSTGGEAKLNAYAPDYACVIDGLLALHAATKEKKWLEHAAKLQEQQDLLFWDNEFGGYFYTSNDHESLLARAKRVNDGAVPSGNSVSVKNLIVLSKKLGKQEYLERAKKAALNASALLAQYPLAAPRLLIGVRELTAPNNEDIKK